MGTVIFDLDGTLADTSGDLIAAANHCFRLMGHGDVLDAYDDAAVSVRGARLMLARGLERVEAYDPVTVEKYYPVFLDAYAAEIDTHTFLFPGALDAVQALKSGGYRVGICTNKPEGLAELLLTRMGIRAEFASMVGAGTLPVSKPDPAPLFEAVLRAGGEADRAVLVGDSVTDRDTARAAGMPLVLVGFGPSGEDMAALAPDALLHHFDDLAAIVPELIG